MKVTRSCIPKSTKGLQNEEVFGQKDTSALEYAISLDESLDLSLCMTCDQPSNQATPSALHRRVDKTDICLQDSRVWLSPLQHAF